MRWATFWFTGLSSTMSARSGASPATGADGACTIARSSGRPASTCTSVSHSCDWRTGFESPASKPMARTASAPPFTTPIDDKSTSGVPASRGLRRKSRAVVCPSISGICMSRMTRPKGSSSMA